MKSFVFNKYPSNTYHQRSLGKLLYSVDSYSLLHISYMFNFKKAAQMRGDNDSYINDSAEHFVDSD